MRLHTHARPDSCRLQSRCPLLHCKQPPRETVMSATATAPPSPTAAVPTRTIICSDAIAWLRSLPDDGGARVQTCNSHAATATPSPYSSPLDAQTHVFTSLPDISELPYELVGGGSMPAMQRAQLYSTWFVEAATLLMSKMAPGTFCIFLQSDARMTDRVSGKEAASCGPAAAGRGSNRADQGGAGDSASTGGSQGGSGTGGRAGAADGHDREGTQDSTDASTSTNVPEVQAPASPSSTNTTHASTNSISTAAGGTPTAPASKDHVVMWLDKGHLCHKAAQAAGCTLVWHKVVLTSTLGKRCFGRPSYSHLLCFGKGPAAAISYPSQSYGTPDVFDRGDMLWARGIGLDCALLGVAFLKTIGSARRVADPFCGVGTVLAMANVLGLDALGVELSPSRCKKAAGVDLFEAVVAMGAGKRSTLGLGRGTQLCKEFQVAMQGVGKAGGEETTAEAEQDGAAGEAAGTHAGSAKRRLGKQGDNHPRAAAGDAERPLPA